MIQTNYQLLPPCNVVPSGTPPSPRAGAPVVGQVYYDTTDVTAKVWNGTAWIAIDASKVANSYIPLAKLATDPLARANHTGTQTASTNCDQTAKATSGRR